MNDVLINPLWELYYSGKYIMIYDCSKQLKSIAFYKWFGFFDLNDSIFINEMKLSLKFIKEKKVIVIVADYSGLKPVPQKAMEWAHNNWYPNAYENGLRVEANIITGSATTNLSLNRMIKNDQALTGKIRTPLFKTFEEVWQYGVNYLNKKGDV